MVSGISFFWGVQTTNNSLPSPESDIIHLDSLDFLHQKQLFAAKNDVSMNLLVVLNGVNNYSALSIELNVIKENSAGSRP